MAATEPNKVVAHLRGVLVKQDAAGASDAELLTRYVRQRDEAAFEALLRRHGPMVLGVCRRVLREHHDAEDAFQATFLVLVRKAATLRCPGTVANWLYGVACRTANQARRALARRRAKEAQVVPRADSPHDPGSDLRDVLDRELERLPEKYRAAVILCDLEGATGKEAAGHLGLPAGTVASRLARGRALLAKRLARQGFATAGAALPGVLAQGVCAGVPAALVSSTLRAAGLFAAGQAVAAGAISAQVAALTEGVLRTMLLSKLKTALTVFLLVCLVGAGVGASLLRGQARPDRPVAEQPPTQRGVADPAKPSPRTAAQDKEDPRWAALQRRLGDLEKQLRTLMGELEALRKDLKPLARPPASAGKIHVFRLRHLQADEVAKTLKDLFAGRLAGGGLGIAASPSTNSVLVQGAEEELAVIEATISRLEDQPVRRPEKDKERKQE